MSRRATSDHFSEVASNTGSSSSAVSLAKRRAAADARIQGRARHHELLRKKIEAEQQQMEAEKQKIEAEQKKKEAERKKMEAELELEQYEDEMEIREVDAQEQVEKVMQEQEISVKPQILDRFLQDSSHYNQMDQGVSNFTGGETYGDPANAPADNSASYSTQYNVLPKQRNQLEPAMERLYPAPAQRSSLDHAQVPTLQTSTVHDQMGNKMKDYGSRGPPARSAVGQEQFRSSSMLSFGFREPTAMPTPAALFVQQQQLIHAMTAPRLEIPTFDGNPMKYYTFIRAFDENVDKMMSDDGAKLARLRQNCVGAAKRVLEACSYRDPTEGYREARSLLKQRFGSEYEIAQLWIREVTGEGSIKVDGLREFADRLQTCYRALVAMHCLMEIDTQGNLLRIVSKLPGYLQARWRSKVADIKENDNRLPTLVDLVKFVERAALEAADPVFGTVKRQDWQHENKQSTFTTMISSQKRCQICSGNHEVRECKDVKQRSPEERFTLLKRHRLCFNCLKEDHTAHDCESRERCKADGCGRKHSTLLHQEVWKPVINSEKGSNVEDGSQGEETDEPKEVSVHNGCIGGTSKRIAVPIVAVNVRAPASNKCVRTYALLDTGSTNTICSQELFDELGIKGRAEAVSLTTLSSSGSTSGMRVASPEVTELEGMGNLRLPAVYAKNRLAINQEHVATKKDVMRWRHLREVDIPMVGTEKVKLLIGQDMPEALIPINVIRGGEGEPWAAQTLLGRNNLPKKIRCSSSVPSFKSALKTHLFKQSFGV